MPETLISPKGEYQPGGENKFLTGVYLDRSFPISWVTTIQLLGKMYGDYLDRVVLEKQKVEMPVINVTIDKDIFN